MQTIQIQVELSPDGKRYGAFRVVQGGEHYNGRDKQPFATLAVVAAEQDPALLEAWQEFLKAHVVRVAEAQGAAVGRFVKTGGAENN